ncbi:unnamed protein product [Thelazia callipaeda]|uniref:CaM_binding domain-containing protein n=1 Tax=Thelazia callipaeda TaxID=103827 RepID=A0A0N5CXY3_THECL|nr:unnamed protein product [Thelazia callipaeda]
MSYNAENKKLPLHPPSEKSRRNEPLKVANVRTRPGLARAPNIPTTRPPRTITKPRQSLLPPKASQVVMKCDKPLKDENKNNCKLAQSKIKPSSSSKSELSVSGLPTSSTVLAARTAKAGRGQVSVVTKMELDECAKIKRLGDAVRGFDILAIVFNQHVEKVR